MAEFEWPWQYAFPPFFTLQPNLDTRRKQLDAWSALVLSYLQYHKQHTLDINDAQSSPLFSNKKINRKLSLDMINTVLEELRKKGNIEWTDKGKRQCMVMWRTPEEWGKLIYKWAVDTGHTNTVCTLYELTEGDDTKNTEFHGIENWLLLRALKTLEQQRKAELISFDGNEGVKFF